MGMKTNIYAVLALAFVLTACEKNDSGDPAASATFRILYSSKKATNFEVLSQQGTNTPVALTNNASLDSRFPRVSANRSKVLFLRYPVGDTAAANAEVWAMDPDGANQRKLISKNTLGLSAIASANWSPDGSLILLQARSAATGYWQIYTTDASGANPVKISTRNTHYYTPAFSNNGSRIAFASFPNGASTGNEANLEIYMMNADGSSEKQFTSDAFKDISPVWSPDNNLIVFTSYTDLIFQNVGRSGFRTVDPVRNSINPLMTDINSNIQPRFNPAGDFIFFQRLQFGSGNSKISCIRSDGTQLVDVTSGSGSEDRDVDVLN